MKIHLLGPSGSGTSTLGKALAARLDLPWFDSDNFFWFQTEPQFTAKRPVDERARLLRETLARNEGWVLSGSLLGWGDFIKETVNLVIYKYVGQEERLRRLELRERERFGDRLLAGNDMHQNHVDFLAWARRYETGGMDVRSIASENAWMSDLSCRVIRLETPMPTEKEVEFVLRAIAQ